MDSDSNIIQFPELSSLEEEIAKLEERVCGLIVKKDELTYLECRNIEMLYTLEVIRPVYKVALLLYRIRRVREEIASLDQRSEAGRMDDPESSHNPGTDLSHMEFILLNLNKRIKAAERFKTFGKYLTCQEEDELKKVYSRIIIAYHPSLNVFASQSELRLWYDATLAYEDGDVATLRHIAKGIEKSNSPRSDLDGEGLLELRENLIKAKDGIKAEIDGIKSSYPYTSKTVLKNQELLSAKLKVIENLTERLRSILESHKKQLKRLLGSWQNM